MKTKTRNKNKKLRIMLNQNYLHLSKPRVVWAPLPRNDMCNHAMWQCVIVGFRPNPVEIFAIFAWSWKKDLMLLLYMTSLSQASGTHLQPCHVTVCHSRILTKSRRNICNFCLIVEKGSYASAVYDFPLTSKWDPPMWVPLACEREVIYSGYTKYLLLILTHSGFS